MVLCDMAPIVVQEQDPLPPCEQMLTAVDRVQVEHGVGLGLVVTSN